MCWGISLCNNSKENLKLLKWCRNSGNLTQLNNYKPPLLWDSKIAEHSERIKCNLTRKYIDTSKNGQWIEQKEKEDGQFVHCLTREDERNNMFEKAKNDNETTNDNGRIWLHKVHSVDRTWRACLGRTPHVTVFPSSKFQIH